MQALALTQVRFIPAATPPHRPIPTVSSLQRLHMVQLAISDDVGFCVDAREVERAGVSFTIDTLESVQREFSAQDARLCLILGLDAFLGLESWRRWRDILRLAHIVVMQRPGADTMTLPPWAHGIIADSAALQQQRGGAVIMQAVTPQLISASAIRAAIVRGGDVMALPLPSAVASYIRNHQLYLGNKETDASKKDAATYF